MLDTSMLIKSFLYNLRHFAEGEVVIVFQNFKRLYCSFYNPLISFYWWLPTVLPKWWVGETQKRIFICSQKLLCWGRTQRLFNPKSRPTSMFCAIWGVKALVNKQWCTWWELRSPQSYNRQKSLKSQICIRSRTNAEILPTTYWFLQQGSPF